MRKFILLPLLSIAAGIAGAYLRTLQLETGFEAKTGLPIAGNIYTIVLIALTGMIALCFALSLVGKNTCTIEDGYSIKPLGGAGIVLAGIALLASAYFNWGSNELALIDKIFIVAAAVCAICTVVRGILIFTEKDSPGLALIIVFFGCFWLIITYKEDAANPVILDYIFRVAAIICGICGYYLSAGAQMGFDRAKTAEFCSLMGIYFSVVILAEPNALGIKLMYIFNILYLTVLSGVLLRKRKSIPEQE